MNVKYEWNHVVMSQILYLRRLSVISTVSGSGLGVHWDNI